MPVESFFSQTNCDRCKVGLKNYSKTVSLCSEETICFDCFLKETNNLNNINSVTVTF